MLKRHILFLLLIGLLAACGVPDRDIRRTEVAATGIGVSGERFEAEVTGDVEVTINPGFAQYYFAEDLGVFTLLLHDGADSEYLVTFLLPPDISPGTYEITRNVQRPQDIDGVKVTLAGPPDVANFSMNVSGSFTLDSIGDTVAGRFSFTASNLDGESVSVTGSFEDVIRTD